jgi:exodeoxyribonuclease VII large subunit
MRMETLGRARLYRMNDRLQQLSSRLARQNVAWRANAARERLTAIDGRLARAAQERLRMGLQQQTGLARQLRALSPLAVLRRGYALVYDEHGRLVKETESLAEGQTIVTRLARGRVHSRVSEIEPETGEL